MKIYNNYSIGFLALLCPAAVGFVHNNLPTCKRVVGAAITSPLSPSAGNSRCTATRLYTSPEPLATEGSWQAFLDEETTGLVYYFDTETGTSLWEPPTDSFPPVKLPRKKQRIAEELRKKYRKERQQSEESKQRGGMFFTNGQANGANGEATTATATEEKTTKVNEPNWIEGLLDERRKKMAGDIGTKAKDSSSERTGSWFGSLFGDDSDERNGKSSTTEEVTKSSSSSSSSSSSTTTTAKEPPVTEEKKSLITSLFGNNDNNKGNTQVADEVKVSVEPISQVQPDARVRPKRTMAVRDRLREEFVEVIDVPKPIKIEMAAFVSPHPAKVRWGGEDAVFTKGRTFGVFDGVSGAEKLDGVPLYSKTLANEMKKMVGSEGLSIQAMTMYLDEAAEFADSCATGASTAIVASLGEDGFLQVLNLGDSTCIVIRDGKIVAKSREISHYFDCPYQLSEDSPDRPRDATKLNVELIAGDIVVMGSDGVFDNLQEGQILETVAASGQKRAAQLAKQLVELSRKVSLDPKADTPYALLAQRQGDPEFKDGVGGKVDDSSCVVVCCK